MKVFGFNSPYSEDFDPYLVPAETKEEAIAIIRKAYPTKIFNVYVMEELLHPGLPTTPHVSGIHILKYVEMLR